MLMLAQTCSCSRFKTKRLPLALAHPEDLIGRVLLCTKARQQSDTVRQRITLHECKTDQIVDHNAAHTMVGVCRWHYRYQWARKPSKCKKNMFISWNRVKMWKCEAETKVRTIDLIKRSRMIPSVADFEGILISRKCLQAFVQ
jgi:hypothetical protein